jgi:Ca2+-binding RTX toxin-like protein
VDNASDVVIENAGEGTDTVESWISYTLGNNVENLMLAGTSAINGTGNSLNNALYGNSGDNILNGGTGADTMSGGAGNDTYYVDNVGDVIVETSGWDIDWVYSSVSYTLGSYLELLIQTGTSAINGTGNELDNYIGGNSGNNYLTGGAGNDTLNGGAGIDTMSGGIGNDTYNVDIAADVVIENAGEGTDTVESWISYTLGTNLENMILEGTSTLNGTGNSANNVLTGNSANNVLDGGTGADTMIGGGGDDTYYVDDTGDVVIENAGEGWWDMVQSSITYTLSANVDALTLTGTSNINGTGNSLDNFILGNSGNNVLTDGTGNDTLNGGAGIDTMSGGIGNDCYNVDNASDVVIENAGEGTDTVESWISYTLGNNVENLMLAGTSALNGTGNSVNNVLTGNSAVNTLTGNAGNDTLDGGTGNDSLVGGTGSDTYVYRSTDGQDTITDYSTQSGETDVVQMTGGISETNPVIVKQDNDLYLFIDANNYAKITSQFQSSDYGIEKLAVTDGYYITRSDIENIVNTMSSINNDANLDVIQKYNAMRADQTYISTLSQSWHQPS